MDVATGDAALSHKSVRPFATKLTREKTKIHTPCTQKRFWPHDLAHQTCPLSCLGSQQCQSCLNVSNGYAAFEAPHSENTRGFSSQVRQYGRAAAEAKSSKTLKTNSCTSHFLGNFCTILSRPVLASSLMTSSYDIPSRPSLAISSSNVLWLHLLSRLLGDHLARPLYSNLRARCLWDPFATSSHKGSPPRPLLDFFQDVLSPFTTSLADDLS